MIKGILIVVFSTLALVVFSQNELPQLENPMTEEYFDKSVRGELPRLVYTKSTVKQIRKRIEKDPVLQNIYAAIKHNASAIYDEPLLERTLKGKRLLGISRELLYRMDILGFVYLMEEDEKTLNRINEELIAVCNFTDWNQKHFLDVGEMSLGVALALDWTQNKLPPSTIKLAKTALKEKAIEKSWPRDGRVWHISVGENNWNQVCAGGLIAASIALAEDEPGLAAKTIHRALDGLPHALVAYGPDGVYPEGSTYWQYATRYSVATIMMFESAFGTDFGHYDIPGFKESAMFRLLCNAPSGLYYNFFDCSDKRGKNGDETLAWFAMKSGVGAYFEKERFLKPVSEMDKLSRFSGMAMAWLSQYKPSSELEVPTAWSGQGPNPITIFKSKATDPHGFYLGSKGGRASISHGNMDAGSFVFELNGVRWAVDLGGQDYNELEKTGFDLWGKGQEADRWKLLTKNNFGHNTLSINNQPFIYDAFAPLIDFRNGQIPEATFDLTPVYGGNIDKAHRKFIRENGSSLLIEDELELSEKTRLITWQMMTLADVEIIPGGAILTQDGKKLRLENLSHPDLDLSVVSLYPAPLELDRQIEGLKRLEIRIPAWTVADGNTRIKIRLTEYK